MNSITFSTGKTLLPVMLLASKLVTAQISSSTKAHDTMNTIQQNKNVVTRLYAQILNHRQFDKLEEVISSDYTGVGGTKGYDAFKQPVMAVIKALPDAKWSIEELVADEHKVVLRWKVTGTHTGPFQNFPATGKAIASEGIGFFDLADGTIISSRVMTDRLGFLQQLGVLPVDLSSLSNATLRKEHVVFVDKFSIPAPAVEEFMARVDINRKMIRTMSGFVEDAAYERKEDNGNIVFITVAIWKDMQSLQSAKAAVQARYQEEGFNPAAMMERLNITMERGT
jgi:steroid delta-isomerase-like uncharacterized protein